MFTLLFLRRLRKTNILGLIEIEIIKMYFQRSGILTICFSVYLFDERRFTASI